MSVGLVYNVLINVPRSCDLSPHSIRTPRKSQDPPKNYQDPDTKSRRGLDEISTRSYNTSRVAKLFRISTRYPSQNLVENHT